MSCVECGAPCQGSRCKQCEIESKWEPGDEHALDGEYSPECFNCSAEVQNKEYHPTKPGAVLCQECYREVNQDRDAFADGGLPLATTTVELLTEHGKQTIEVDRKPLATDAATIDQARKCADVDVDEFLGGELR